MSLPICLADFSFIFILTLCTYQLAAIIIMAAISIAIIIFSGPHEVVHLNSPAMSKKNIATAFNVPVIDANAVIISEAITFRTPSPRNGISPATLNINMKKPIKTPSVTISCCHVAPSFIPNITFMGVSRACGKFTSFSKTFSVLISSPPLSALSCSCAGPVMFS